MKSLKIHFLALLMAAGVSSAAEVTTPNIVLFFVDDLGWADLGYRNPAVFESPNIDKLAAQGTDFTQAYIACPTCSPSRATLLTGQHPTRIGFARHIYTGDPKAGFDKTGRTSQEFAVFENDPAQFPSRNWLPLELTTYAEALNERGYFNEFVGKWHLGSEEYFPTKQGFASEIGTANAGHPRSYVPPFFKDSEVFADEQERYLTDKLTDESVEFIEGYNRDQPFMLSLWYYSVHSPHIGRADLVKHFEAKGLTGAYAHYAAMVKAVDESVGRVRAALEAKGVADNTIIIFLSDQGGAFQNGPFHGGKKSDTLYEGGARVPFIFHWPGVTQSGSTNDSIVQSTDLFPTLVEIAGGEPANYANLDGVSLVSTLRENSLLKRGEPIFGFRAYEDLYASVRDGDWKLLAYRSGTIKLYNIAEDIGETTDLARTHPARVEALRHKLIAWENKMGVATYSGVQ